MAKSQYFSLESVKRSIYNIVKHAPENGTSQKRVFELVDGFINDMKPYPKNERVIARAYFSGMFEFMSDQDTVFLYNVDGKLYATKQNKDLDFPHWETLDGDVSEITKKIGSLGGMYYKNGKPFCNRAVQLSEK
jgi:hypothetical protein